MNKKLKRIKVHHILIALAIAGASLSVLGFTLVHTQTSKADNTASMPYTPTSGNYNVGDQIKLHFEISAPLTVYATSANLEGKFSFSYSSGLELQPVSYDPTGNIMSKHQVDVSFIGMENGLNPGGPLNSPLMQGGLIDLTFKVIKGGAAQVNFSNAFAIVTANGTNYTYPVTMTPGRYSIPVTCSNIANGQSCNDGTITCNSGYVVSGSSCVQQVVCTPIAGGTSCSNGSITCNSGYTRSGNGCAQNPPASSGGGGTSGGGSGGGSGRISPPKSPPSGSSLQAPSNPSAQSNSGTVDQGPLQSQLDNPDLQSPLGDTDSPTYGTDQAPTVIKPATNSADQMAAASQSSSKSWVMWIVLLIAFAIGVGYLFWRRRNRVPAVAPYDDSHFVASDYQSSPQAPTHLSTQYQQAIDQAFRIGPTGSSIIPAQPSQEDPNEPLDMFEQAAQHPDSFGRDTSAPSELQSGLTTREQLPVVQPLQPQPPIDNKIDLVPLPVAPASPAIPNEATNPTKKAKRNSDNNDGTLIISHNN